MYAARTDVCALVRAMCRIATQRHDLGLSLTDHERFSHDAVGRLQKLGDESCDDRAGVNMCAHGMGRLVLRGT